jgi:hypothetical protein
MTVIQYENDKGRRSISVGSGGASFLAFFSGNGWYQAFSGNSRESTRKNPQNVPEIC